MSLQQVEDFVFGDLQRGQKAVLAFSAGNIVGEVLAEEVNNCVSLADFFDLRTEVFFVWDEDVVLFGQLVNVVAFLILTFVSLQEVVAEPGQTEGNAYFLVVELNVVRTQNSQRGLSRAIVADVNHFAGVRSILLHRNYNASYLSILAKKLSAL